MSDPALPASNLPKTFEAASMEAKWYPKWEASGITKADPSRAGKPYAIMMPPPNVTGSLHMGHALNMSLQDILARYHRMRGKNVLWLPGTDHASIATQMVVERQLAEQGIKRQDLGREKFLEKVWVWKEISGNTITSQLRRLGALPDWSRERFTMDDGLNKAVIRAFVQMHQDGLIYRAKRLVNWDPKMQTSVSDLEVIHREVDGKMYHFRYPFADGSGHINIATTRPETILADGAVAVHPDDERYKGLVGKMLLLPIVNRLLPIIADEQADPEFGSGAFKVTAAHDFNDFAVAQRHPEANIPFISLMTKDGRMNENCPADYQGLDRFAARDKVVADFEALGLLEEIVPHKHSVPFSERGGVPVEPMLTDQWYVDTESMAKRAVLAVENGESNFVPKGWENTYFEWLRNIQPWCISRQLWWGHQIPAWYDQHGNVFVAENEADAYGQALSSSARNTGDPNTKVDSLDPRAVRRDDNIVLTQDPDVLDTWFSSGLWPFSTLGWPEQTADLKTYYPGAVLITGFDIIFFWVARMMMMGLYFTKQIPFKDIYIHALVRDASGAKMSKSKGNVIDPLALIDDYGADALRFTLTAMSAQGRDIKLSLQRVEGYRNFTTKIWNAARFAEMHECTMPAGFDPGTVQHPINQWIISTLIDAESQVSTALETYKFNEAANALYSFIWHNFCDWYVEFAKILFFDTNTKTETQSTLAWVYQQMLIILHPFMPFLTEELNATLFNSDQLIATQTWPDFNQLRHPRAGANVAARDLATKQSASLRDAHNILLDSRLRGNDNVRQLIELITAIRSTKAMLNIPPSQMLPVAMQGDQNALKAWEMYKPFLQRLGRVEFISADNFKADQPAARIPLNDITVLMPLPAGMDMAAESARLGKQVDKLAKDIAGLQARLGNADFIAKADPDTVETQREMLAEQQAQHARITDALKQIAI